MGLSVALHIHGLGGPGGSGNRPGGWVWGGPGQEQVPGQLPEAREEAKRPGRGLHPYKPCPHPAEATGRPHTQQGQGSQPPSPGWAYANLGKSTAKPRGSGARTWSLDGQASVLAPWGKRRVLSLWRSPSSACTRPFLTSPHTYRRRWERQEPLGLLELRGPQGEGAPGAMSPLSTRGCLAAPRGGWSPAPSASPYHRGCRLTQLHPPWAARPAPGEESSSGWSPRTPQSPHAPAGEGPSSSNHTHSGRGGEGRGGGLQS